jgi:hypothetical protein
MACHFTGFCFSRELFGFVSFEAFRTEQSESSSVIVRSPAYGTIDRPCRMMPHFVQQYRNITQGTNPLAFDSTQASCRSFNNWNPGNATFFALLCSCSSGLD